jgi:phospholipid/cholesterol/gamma-HCH transport system ATP-binding protein
VIQPVPEPTAIPERPDEIRVEDLHRSFDENCVLRGVDLDVCRGDIVAIVGASGCGKTVLLDHIIGLLQPDRGRVLVANHEREGAPLVELAELDREGMDAIRRHWAVVFQRNALFSGTVYENIALWLREVGGLSETDILPRVQTSLEAVGLDFETVLEKDRDELSGGMAKRVAVARAVAMDPYLIFYDEPTTGLDPQHAAQIHELLDDTHGRAMTDGTARTTVVVTHDKDLLARIGPRVIMLHDGRVFFDGSYDEFQQSDSPLVLPYFALMPVLHQRAPLR